MSRLEFPGPGSQMRRHLEGLRAERARLAAADASLKRRIGMAIAASREMPGLTVEQAAELVGVSRPTAYQYMEMAGAETPEDGHGGTP